MSIVKVINRLIMVLLFVAGFNVFAETAPFRTFEAASLSIKLAKDGTGIIKNVYCSGCDFRVVKITPDSKASIKGVEVNILQANTRAGKSAMVSFDPETREVQYIRW